MRRHLAKFERDRSGAVAVLTAVCLISLMASAAVAVDLGQVFLKSRELQGVADLAALAAVQTLDPTAVSTPAAAAAATAAVNPWSGGISADALTGVYIQDPATPSSQRFTASTLSPNAVKVTLRAPVQLYFAGLLIGRSTLQVSRTALAARAQYAAFSIGSGLASLNGGVANALLSAMTGSQLSLTAMNYQALASAQVDLLHYLPALQTRAGLQGLSYTQVLASSVAPSAALAALADTLNTSGQTDAAATAHTLATAAATMAPTSLSGLLDVGPYGAQDHASSGSGAVLDVGALNLAEALIAAANGSRQLSVGLNGLASGVTQLSATLAIGQRPSRSPWLTVTDTGLVIVRTAQMRLYLQAALAPGGLVNVTSGAPVKLPVYVEVASAEAKLKNINCPAAPASQTLDLSVSPSLGALAIAQVDTSTLNAFDTPVATQTATLLNLPLITATAYGRVDLAGQDWRTVSFSQADIAAGTMRSVYADNIAQATVASLLTRTTLGVKTPAGSFGVSAAVVSPALSALLTQAAPSLDATITALETVSGARLGEADVWADGLRCRGAALVA